MTKKIFAIMFLLVPACDDGHAAVVRDRKEASDIAREEHREKAEAILTEKKFDAQVKRWEWVVECIRRARSYIDDSGDGSASVAKMCATTARDAWILVGVVGGAEPPKTPVQP